jgi:hypothetical protein
MPRCKYCARYPPGPDRGCLSCGRRVPGRAPRPGRRPPPTGDTQAPPVGTGTRADLVIQLVFEHPILVDAGGVRKGVAADHRLVGLHRNAGVPRDQGADLRQARRVDTGSQPERLLAGAKDHHNFFERGVAGPLADAVDRALDPPGAIQDRGDAVRGREAEVVVTVHADQGAVDVADVLADRRDQRPELVGERVAGRVRDVDDRRAGVDHRLERFEEVLEIGAAGIFRRVLDVVAERAGVGNGFDAAAEHIAPVGAQLPLDMDVRHREHHVDLLALGILDGLPHGIDIRTRRPRQRGDHRASNLPGDPLHRLEIAGGGEGEAGLDHVDAEPRELPGDRQFLIRRQRGAGRLLAVAQGGIEDEYAVAGRCRYSGLH